MTFQIAALLASASLIGAGLSSAAEIRSFQALPAVAVSALAGVGTGANAGDACRVDVIRTGAADTASVTRSVVEDRCICTIVTGPEQTNGSAENIVRALLRDRTCDGAPIPGKDVVGEVAQGSGGPGSGVLIGGVIGIGAAAGLAVASGSDSSG